MNRKILNPSFSPPSHPLRLFQQHCLHRLRHLLQLLKKDPVDIETRVKLIPYNVGSRQWPAAEKILRQGIDSKRIATEVGVSPHTVETTLWKVKKLGLLPGSARCCPNFL